MPKANKSGTESASGSKSDSEKSNAVRKVADAELAAKDGVIVPAFIPREVVDAAVGGDARKFLKDRRQEELVAKAEELEKRNEKILATRKERAGEPHREDASKELNPAEGPELIIENPGEEVLEVSVAAETYYLKPGDNRIVSRDLRLSDRAVASFIHGQLLSHGVTFREEAGVAKKSAGKKGAEDVGKIMEQTSTEGAMDVPDSIYEGVKYASNPPGRDRIQPDRFQASGPLDPDGSIARERKRKEIEAHLGVGEEAEGDGGKAKK